MISVLIKKNCDKKEIYIDNIKKLSKNKNIENKGDGKIKLLYVWTFDNNDLNVLLYGWDRGNYKNINKFELPDPLENKIYFGDLIFILKEKDEYLKFTKKDFEEFYEEMFGGFESIENTSDEDNFYNIEDDDYDYNDGFLVRD